LLIGRRETAVVCGVSMIPTLNDGDLVFFKKYNKHKYILQKGDIVIFHHPFKSIQLIKRIKRIEKFSIEVSGDNKDYSNDSNLFGLIQKEKIIGIVTSRIRNKTLNQLKILNQVIKK
tara:strand:- start:117 stop:467 length:351 start_codon:yes stop_codon:yes gene_type:complete